MLLSDQDPGNRRIQVKAPSIVSEDLVGLNEGMINRMMRSPYMAHCPSPRSKSVVVPNLAGTANLLCSPDLNNCAASQQSFETWAVSYRNILSVGARRVFSCIRLRPQ